MFTQLVYNNFSTFTRLVLLLLLFMLWWVAGGIVYEITIIVITRPSPPHLNLALLVCRLKKQEFITENYKRSNY